MTIATNLGFKLGELYRATENATSSNSFYTEGTILKFTEDDDSTCPWFEYVSGPKHSYIDHVGQRIAANLSDLTPVEGCAILNTKTLLALYVKQHHPLDSTLIALIDSL